MRKRIISMKLVLGYLLTVPAIFVFYLYAIPHHSLKAKIICILCCIVSWIIGFVILKKSLGYYYFWEYLWGVNDAKSHKRAMETRAYLDSLTPEQRKAHYEFEREARMYDRMVRAQSEASMARDELNRIKNKMYYS